MFDVTIKLCWRNNKTWVYTVMLDYIRALCKIYKFPLKSQVHCVRIPDCNLHFEYWANLPSPWLSYLHFGLRFPGKGEGANHAE